MATPDIDRLTPIEATRRGNMARIAQGYFIRACVECPSSVSAQAAVMALSARQEGRDIQELGTALHFDNARIYEIIDAARKYHRSDGAKEADLSIVRVRDIVANAFDQAYQFGVLLDAELVFIKTQMFQTVGQDDLTMVQRTQEMVRIAKARAGVERDLLRE